MSALHVVDGGRGESLTEASARRLRGALAERRISGRQLGFAVEKSYAWIQRRLAGEVSLSVADMELIEEAVGIPAAYLITGLNAENRRPTMKSDGGSEVHPPGIEPGTH